jgi:hypothetical protein
MTDQTQARGSKVAERADELIPWLGVFLESLGATLCCLGVIFGSKSTTAGYVLISVGVPLIVLGVLILWWTAR